MATAARRSTEIGTRGEFIEAESARLVGLGGVLQARWRTRRSPRSACSASRSDFPMSPVVSGTLSMMASRRALRASLRTSARIVVASCALVRHVFWRSHNSR